MGLLPSSLLISLLGKVCHYFSLFRVTCAIHESGRMKGNGAREGAEQRGSRGLYGRIVNGGERMHGAALEEKLQL